MKQTITAAAIIIGTLIALSKLAYSAETYHKSLPSDPITKFEAIRVAITKPDTVLYKCSQVQITKKGTFKNIPSSGANDFIVEPTKIK